MCILLNFKVVCIPEQLSHELFYILILGYIIQNLPLNVWRYNFHMCLKASIENRLGSIESIVTMDYICFLNHKL